MNKTKTITTTLIPYEFDISKPEQAKKYESLCESIRACTPCKEPMPGLTIVNQGHPKELLDNGELIVELELGHIFNNQWNAAPGHGSKNGWRVFDWAENIYPNKSIKHGYYLVSTSEMLEVRRNTVACGYCDKQEPAQKGLMFCDKCLGSPHLTEKDLHLLRMVPVHNDRNRPELTQAERDWLMPQFVEAQINSKTERDKRLLKEKRQRIEERYEQALIDANNEHHGMVFLLNHGISTDNVIYYNHTKRFCFGWQKPIGKEVWDRLNEVLSEFPCAYDVKTDFDGVKSSG